MKIQLYRSQSGRFTNLRSKLLRVLVYQLIILSLVGNAWQYRHYTAIRCKVNGQVVGYFVSKEVCGELAKSDEDSRELGRQEVLANNSDL